MLPSWANQTIVRMRPTLKDSRGSMIPDWTKPDQLTISGCSVQPSSTSLSQDGRVLGISDSWTAYLPEGSDVKEGDRIVFDGMTFTINGEPRKWTAAFTRSNIQLNLTRWHG